MNAPDFNFGPERRDRGLPTSIIRGGRDMGSAMGPVPAMGPSVESTAAEPEGLNLRDEFFKIIGLAIKHRWLVLACCLCGLFIGFVVTFTTTPIYRATATIKVDPEAARVVKLDTVDSGQVGDIYRFYQTQKELLKSRSLAERVASSLDLRDAAGFVSPRDTSSWARLLQMIIPAKAEQKPDLVQRKAAAAGLIQGGLSVNQAPNSSLVTISFDGPDPGWAQKIANAVADGFTEANLERRYGTTTYARKFIEEKLEELKVKLEESEKALVAYEDKEQIISPGGKDHQPIADSDLLSLNAALQQVRTERRKSQELWEHGDQNGLSLP